MADSFSPWVGAKNKLQPPKGVDPAWAGRMSQGSLLRNYGSFAGDDDPPPAPAQVPGQYQGQGMTINGTPPQKAPPLQVNISGAHFYGGQKKLPAAPPHVPGTPAAPTPAPIASAQPSMPADDGSYIVPDDTAYQALLAKLDEANVSGIGAQKQGISDTEARLNEVTNKTPDVDLSALFAYQKATQGMDLGEGYRRPQTQADLDKQADDLRAALQKERQGLTDDQIKILDSALGAEGRRLGIDEQGLQRVELARLQGADRAAQLQDRLDVTKRGQDLAAAGRAATNARMAGKGNNSAYQKLIHDTNPTLASSRSDLGRNQAVVTSAKKIETLGGQGRSQSGGLDTRQIEEVAAATASLLQNGSVGAQGTIRRLVPKSFSADKAGIQEYIKGLPVGAGQQAFVDRMLETARRERELAEGNIKAFQTGAYKDAKSLLTPEQAAEYERNHPHVTGASTAPAGGGGLLDAIRAEQAKRAAAGGGK